MSRLPLQPSAWFSAVVVFSLAGGSLGVSGWLVGRYNEDANRRRYIDLFAENVGLPIEIDRVENGDLEHRWIHGLRIFRPDGRTVALAAPATWAGFTSDGDRIFRAVGAELDLGDGRWFQDRVRFKSQGRRRIAEIYVSQSTIRFSPQAAGRTVPLEFTDVSGVLDFTRRPLIHARLEATVLNGTALERPIRVFARLNREPAFAVEEVRIDLTPAVPLACLRGAGVLPEAWTAGSAAGTVVVRRAAGADAAEVELIDFAADIPSMPIGGGSQIGVARLEIARGAFRAGALSAGPVRLRLPTRTPEPLELRVERITAAPDAGTVEALGVAGEFDWFGRRLRVAGPRLDLEQGAGELIGRLLVDRAGGRALPAPASIRFAASAQSTSAGRLRVVFDPTAPADLAAFEPRLAALSAGRVSAELDIIASGSQVSATGSAAALGLSPADLLALAGIRLPASTGLPAGSADLVIDDFRLADGMLESMTARARLAAGTSGEPDVQVEGLLVGQRSPDGMDWRLHAAGKANSAAALSAALGGPRLDGRLEFRLVDALGRGERLTSARLELSGRLQDAAPALEYFGLQPFAGAVEIDRLSIEVADGKVAAAELAGRATGLDLSQVTRAAGFGKVEGRADLEVPRFRLADGKITALQAFLCDAPGYTGPRRVSAETVDALSQTIGFSLPVSIGFVTYEWVGVGLERRDDGWFVHGPPGWASTLGKLKIGFLPGVPVVVPERYRRLDAARMETLEKQAWEAIRSLDLNRLAPAR